ncbi:hypothetical protein QQF64_002091 [Cirrhinus molitorella]|uniref:Uncharacterized protein n=2 Tax=Cirrhinus molitorella TaxID=172907 RepID=A0AA88TB96_9TELE|nr:hypothetical protein Q8A67_023508 [Cirrhinus molitorella]
MNKGLMGLERLEVPRVSFSTRTHGFDKWKTREEEKHRNSLLPEIVWKKKEQSLALHIRMNHPAIREQTESSGKNIREK